MSDSAVISPLFPPPAASMPVGADDGGAELNVELSLRNGYSSVGAAGDMHAHPETGQYSFLKPLLFWINPLIAIAQKGSITEDDIWTTPADCDVDLNAESLRQAYKIAHDCSGVDSPGGGLQWPWGQRVQSSFKDKLPAFGWSILIAFRRCIYVSGIYHVCFAALQLTLPYLIGELLAYIATGEGGPGRGFSLVAALGATSAASSYCIIGTFYEMRRGALQVKAATMMNVYRQSLQLTTASR